ncbi:MAG TPA: energy transducer TonB [Verrucomicrobiae bacterium]|nr:energy transducer TonB [Verrucomicrobiae bacterium]
MLRKALFLFPALFFFNLFIAHADAVKDALDQKYKKHVLAVRIPFTGGTEKFDSSGQPLKVPNKGQWVTYGGIYIEKINISKDTLRLEGPRVADSGQKKDGKPVFIKLEKSLKFELHLDQPLQSMDDAQAMLGHIFYLDPAEAEKHIKPEIRRYESVAKGPIHHVGEAMKDGVKASNGVKAPNPTYTPEPDFSEEARRAKFQGVVILSIIVDETGNVSQVKLERPLGRGLDDNAMQRVKTWRFDPARLNGEPVAVEMKIEVSFNLY